MKKLKAYKIRIYPNETQKVQLAKTFGSCRFLYNQMLSERKYVYEQFKDDKERLHSYAYKTEKQYKFEFEFLKEIESTCLQQSRIDLNAAYANFFRRVKNSKIKEKGFPNFKKKNAKNSFRVQCVNANIKVDFKRKKVKLPKIGWINYHDPRIIEKINIHSATVSKTTTDKYYISMLYDVEIPEPKQLDLKAKDLKVKGLDMSLTNFFVDDEGNSPMYDRNYRKFENKIQSIQRMLSTETKKFKKIKLRKRLAKVHEHVANKRKDFIEKLSYKLVHDNDVIVVETLSLKDIAKFRTWEERKNSSDKSNHGKSTYDLGWSMFLNRLKTKAEENGKIIIEANQWFASSKTCNHCGYVNKDLAIEDREWTCPSCGSKLMRDTNAAQNLKDLGLRFLAEGSSVNADVSRNGNHLQ